MKNQKNNTRDLSKSRIKTYIIKDTETQLIKIGKSIDPNSRLNVLQCGSSNKLVLCHVFDADIESLLHKTFKPNRKHSEWFDLNCDVIVDFCSVLDLSEYQFSSSDFYKNRNKIIEETDNGLAHAFPPLDDYGLPREYVESENRYRDNGCEFYKQQRYQSLETIKEYNMVNMIVFNMNEETLRLVYGINDFDDIERHLSENQLSALNSIIRANTVYIEDGFDFQDRKDKLTKLFNRKHKQKLIDEVKRLEE